MTPLIQSEVSGQIAQLRLARPDKRNAVNHQMADEAGVALEEFAAQGLQIGVLSAEGPVFSSGADLGEATADPSNPATERLLAALNASDVMWIAAVEGPVLGAGISLLAACPVVIASDDVWFSLPEWKIGLFPTGVIVDMEPMLGARESLRLGLTGDQMSARQALAAGLVTEVVPKSELADRVKAWAEMLQERSDVLKSAREYWRLRFDSVHYRERAETLRRLLEAQHV